MHKGYIRNLSIEDFCHNQNAPCYTLKRYYMKHKLQRIIILTSLCVCPLLAVAGDVALWTGNGSNIETTDTYNLTEIEITVQGRQVIISNAQGKFLEIYDITGKRVHYVQIDSHKMHLTLNLHKGCYIMRVGDVTRKIYLS